MGAEEPTERNEKAGWGTATHQSVFLNTWRYV